MALPLRRFAALFAASVLLAACPANTEDGADDSPTDTPPVAETTPGPPPTTVTTVPTGDFEFDDCEFDVPAAQMVDCGWLEVPAQWSKPDGDTIRLHFAVFRSSSDAPASDPVVYLEGGPGGESLDTLAFVFEDSFAYLLADRDVIFLDQRGIGYSEPSLECPEVRDLAWEVIDQILEPDTYNQMVFDALDECRGRLVDEGADLSGFNSAESASDLAALRLALGYEEWNLYGISYGTRLAQTVMRDHPDGLRSVILDSAYPLEQNLYTDTVESMDRALNQLFDGCESDPACNDAYPNLDRVFWDTVDVLNESPIRAPVSDVWTGQTYDGVFDGTALSGIVFQSLYSDAVIPALPRLISDVANGNTYELALLASSFLANGEFVSIGMQYSVQCNEEAVFTNREEVAAAIAQHPDLEGFFATATNLGPPAFDVCDMWGAGVADPIEDQPVQSSVPTLVLSGQYDPITPPEWGSNVASTLGSATYINIPSGGHGPSASLECPQSLLRAFLDDPTAALDTGCVDEMGLVVFEVPGQTAETVEMAPFSDDYGTVTLTGVAPEGWESVAQGVWTRGESGLDQTALIQQFAPGLDANTLLDILLSQLGIEGSPELAETRSNSLGEWSIYEADLAGTPAVYGVVDTAEGAAFALLTAAPHEIEALQASVFYTAIDTMGIE